MDVSFQGAGTYRLRMHARGRNRAGDLVPDEPVENYLLCVWPAPPAPEVVHKQTDHYGAGIWARAQRGRPHFRSPWLT